MPNPVHNDIRATNVCAVVSFLLVVAMLFCFAGAWLQ